MNTNRQFSTPLASSLIPKLVEAGLSGNRQRLELLSLTAIRTLKRDCPELAEEIGSVLASFTASAASLRWQGTEPPPTDTDAGLALLRIHHPDDAPEPVFAPTLRAAITRFVAERRESERLLREGFAPPRTLLLKGPPGTGKTMLARWLTKELGLPLAVLDLSTAISSYLGKTGANLRRSLDYARATPCVLLLDEFDAIAKRRDDDTEVGELKRIVNVLLKELEDWPLHSIIVAATNHPELLDPAVHRRFDVVVTVPQPSEDERHVILAKSCGRFIETLPSGFLGALSRSLVGRNGSELNTMAQASVRRHVVEQVPLAQCLIEELEKSLPDGLPKNELGTLIRSIKEATELSVREIGELIGKGSSTVQYHLKKKENRDA